MSENDDSTFKASPVINKQYILDNLSQERIMEYYLGVKVQCQYMIKSPLRVDNNPTCNFSWKHGRLWFRDWAMSRPYDVFDIVKKKYLCNFGEAIDIIAEDFGLKDSEVSRKLAMKEDKPDEKTRGNRNSEKSNIQVRIQKFTQTDIDYLTSYGISSSTVKKFNVFSPAVVWLNGKPFYRYDKQNPALAYYFGKDENGHQKWKIYFYMKRGDFKFLGNTSRINGWVQIPDEGDLLILTKSLKDVMAMYEFNLDAVAMQGESTIPYDYIIEELKERFDRIITIYDDDEAGRRYAHRIHELYKIPYYFITEQSLGVCSDGDKDFSDFVKNHTYWETKELVEAIKSTSDGKNWNSAQEEPDDLQREATT